MQRKDTGKKGPEKSGGYAEQRGREKCREQLGKKADKNAEKSREKGQEKKAKKRTRKIVMETPGKEFEECREKSR